MKNLLKTAKELAKVRAELKGMDDLMKPLKEERDRLQSELMEAMRNSELKSLKTDTASYSLATKKDIRVTDEAAVIKALTKINQKEYYVKEKLDTVAFKSYAKSLLSETGEFLDGTEPTQTEYISIRSVKQS